MKKSRPVYKFADNASKLQKRIGELLVGPASPFKFYEIRQEYPVKKVNPSFKSAREKFDYVILGLNVVIELHGAQHEKVVCFGGKPKEEAEEDLRKRILKDKQKKQAALDAEWTYVVVWYYESDITIEQLTERIYSNYKETQEIYDDQS
jgi:G:T-mismatch repair DNA endonuclease (very short patch repair protein)